MGSSESTKRLTVERSGEEGSPGILKVSYNFNVNGYLQPGQLQYSCFSQSDEIQYKFSLV